MTKVSKSKARQPHRNTFEAMSNMWINSVESVNSKSDCSRSLVKCFKRVIVKYPDENVPVGYKIKRRKRPPRKLTNSTTVHSMT